MAKLCWIQFWRQEKIITALAMWGGCFGDCSEWKKKKKKGAK